MGIHTKETRTERNTCTPVFITTLFLIAWISVQPRCPLEDELLKNLWYICTMEYYLTLKKNTFESFLMRWIKLEPIIPTEVSQNNNNNKKNPPIQYTNAYISAESQREESCP